MFMPSFLDGKPRVEAAAAFRHKALLALASLSVAVSVQTPVATPGRVDVVVDGASNAYFNSAKADTSGDGKAHLHSKRPDPIKKVTNTSRSLLQKDGNATGTLNGSTGRASAVNSSLSPSQPVQDSSKPLARVLQKEAETSTSDLDQASSTKPRPRPGEDSSQTTGTSDMMSDIMKLVTGKVVVQAATDMLVGECASGQWRCTIVKFLVMALVVFLIFTLIYCMLTNLCACAESILFIVAVCGVVYFVFITFMSK